MNYKFRSIITKEHFQKNPPDMLDITIFEVINMAPNKPFDTYDIDMHLQEKGITGYERKDIEERLKQRADMYELIRVRTGYLQATESHEFTMQMELSFGECRRPPGIILKRDPNPRLHSYIEDGTDTERCHRIPVPTGARIFARIYTIKSSKYHTEFYSHIYGFSMQNGPFMPIDIWFYGEHL